MERLEARHRFRQSLQQKDIASRRTWNVIKLTPRPFFYNRQDNDKAERQFRKPRQQDFIDKQEHCDCGSEQDIFDSEDDSDKNWNDRAQRNGFQPETGSFKLIVSDYKEQLQKTYIFRNQLRQFVRFLQQRYSIAFKKFIELQQEQQFRQLVKLQQEQFVKLQQKQFKLLFRLFKQEFGRLQRRWRI